MAEVAPKSVAKVDPVFEKRLVDLIKHAAHDATQRKLGGQVRWYRPTGWDGNLFDLAGYGPPHSRETANADYLAAVAPEQPGVTGDLAATATMVDFLATMERALRNRHTMRRPRAMAHALARAQGHGNASGPYGAILEHVREILRLAKEPQA